MIIRNHSINFFQVAVKYFLKFLFKFRLFLYENVNLVQDFLASLEPEICMFFGRDQ